MADKTLRVQQTAEPTFWNYTLGKGAAIGALLFSLPGALIGAVIGGFMGKSRMAQEQQDGKDVPPPTFWNRTALFGAALASFAIGIGLRAGYGSLGAAVDSLGGLGTLGVVAGGIGGGIILGGIAGKSRMEGEYRQAQEYVAGHGGEYMGRAYELARGGQVQLPERNYTVTPEEMALLESRLAGGRASHADRTAAQQQPMQPTT